MAIELVYRNSGSGVKSINGMSGAVVLTAEDVGAATKEYVDLAIELSGGSNAPTVTTETKRGNIVNMTLEGEEKLTISADEAKEVTIVHQGKNFYKPIIPSGSSNGVNWEVKEDGAIRVFGTNTNTGYSFLNVIKKAEPMYLPAGNYTFSGAGLPAGTSFYVTSAVDNQGTRLNFEITNNTFNLTEGAGIYSYFQIPGGATVDFTIYPQLELGYEVTEFEPYKRVELVAALPATLYAFGGVNILYTTGNDEILVSRDIVIESGASISAVNALIAEAMKFDASKYDIPILTLDGDCAGMTKDDAVPLKYTFIDKDGKSISGTADVKKQGSSSVKTGVEIGAGFDKDLGGIFNFTIKFPEAFEAREGWGAQKKYCFKANAIDASHSRNVCSCKLWGDVVRSRKNVPAELASLPNCGAIDGFPVVIVLNGNYYALGTFNIPKDGWMFGSPKAVVSANDHTASTQFKALAAFNGDFDLEYVEDEDNADWVLTSLNRAIQAVIDSNGSNIDNTIGKYIDIPSAIDYYIHCVYENANDGTDKNYLLVTYDGVKWYFSDYDRDTVYGLNWDGKTISSPLGGVTFAGYASSHKLMGLIRVYKAAELKARAIELREGALSEINVCNVFTKFGATIPAELIAQNNRRWCKLRSTNVSNLAQILNWYRLRRMVVDKEIESL